MFFVYYFTIKHSEKLLNHSSFKVFLLLITYINKTTKKNIPLVLHFVN